MVFISPWRHLSPPSRLPLVLRVEPGLNEKRCPPPIMGPQVKTKEVKTKERAPGDPKMVQQGHLVELWSHNQVSIALG